MGTPLYFSIEDNMYKPFIKLTSSTSFWLFIACYILIHVSSNTLYTKKHSETIIESDGVGYYAYLPAIFIYQDLHFNFLEKVENKFASRAHHQVKQEVEGGAVNKYYIGAAILMTPFFLLAEMLTQLTGEVRDGFSMWYQICINFAGIFYCMLGMLFLMKTLQLKKVRPSNQYIVLFLGIFGTNLFYYAIFEPAHSHIYSFAIVNILVYLVVKHVRGLPIWPLITCALLTGLLVIIRPINIMILICLIWLFPSPKSFYTFIYNSFTFKKTFCAVFSGLLVISIQLFIYYFQTGSFIVYSYTQEGFHWLELNLMNALFGFRKGLFIYMPLLLLGVFGVISVFRHHLFQLTTWLISFIIVMYVLSSWWCWWYGGCFGYRAFIEYYFMMFIPLGLWLESSERWVKKSIITIGVLLVIVCQIQTYQYRYYYIHWSNMDYERYKKVFLRVDYLIDKEPSPEEVFDDDHKDTKETN